jgi:hypothetical protein
MKKFDHNDLQGNKFFNLILESFYKDIHNFGHDHYGESFNEKDFYENINLVLNQLFLLKHSKISIIQFKKDFLEKKDKENRGFINFNEKEKRTFASYKGSFVYYSLIIYKLFYIYFHRELKDKVEYFDRIMVFLSDNFIEINRNPINYTVIQKVSKDFQDSGFTAPDMAEYTDLLLEELTSDYDFEVDVSEANVPIMDEEELSTLGLKIMMLKELGVIDFLKEKYELDNNNFKLSKIIHSFTGLDAQKINSIIHPIFSEYSAQKNNPYNNQKNLPKIKGLMQQLMLIE